MSELMLYNIHNLHYLSLETMKMDKDAAFLNCRSLRVQNIHYLHTEYKN